MNSPQINVTPLIDVLLVLLIIFMLVSPMKPSALRTRIPAKDKSKAEAHPETLIVNVNPDRSVDLNRETGLGTVAKPSKLVSRLKEVFDQRARDGKIPNSIADSPERPLNDKVERTVFIKAPRSIDYGSVARVVDAVKISGAFPISLQIDGLN
jgi:biopolymer transport protein ExbD